MKLSLVVITPGKMEGKSIPVKLSQFLIGRDPQCQLRPASALISKRHCALLVRGGKVYVRDFDSTNGTAVNDETVKGERELHNDDRLKVGPLEFRVAMETSPTVSKPTPFPPTAAPDSPEDEAAAAMLLSLQDDVAGSGKTAVDSQGVPEGSTVMDIMNAPGDTAATDAPKSDKEDKAEAAKVAAGNTSSAAKAILEKYMRRPRT